MFMELEELEVGAIYRVKPLVERGFVGLGAFVGPVTCQFIGIADYPEWERRFAVFQQLEDGPHPMLERLEDPPLPFGPLILHTEQHVGWAGPDGPRPDLIELVAHFSPRTEPTG